MFDNKTKLVTHEQPLIATPELQQNLLNAAKYRLQRLSKILLHQGCDAILMYDPVNIRYATDCTNMQVWTMHNQERYALVFADGYTVLWDFNHCEHLTRGNAQIDEVRTAISWSFFSAGDRLDERLKLWASEINDVLRAHIGGAGKLAVDVSLSQAAELLNSFGHTLIGGESVIGQARLIKSDDEIALMQHTIEVAEMGMWRMHQELEPGMTENELWAFLHFENIKHGGEWIETRLLTSGPRTNPWMQESSNRVMHKGELLSFDTDLIGPFGYCADISRCWTVGGTTATDSQKTLYNAAYQQIEHNQSLLQAGLSYREFSEKSWQIPDQYYANRYCCIAHGVGMADENPAIAHTGEDWDKAGYNGVFQANMVISIESYIGAVAGLEGVKLEQQVLITDDGCCALSTFPYEENWLA